MRDGKRESIGDVGEAGKKHSQLHLLQHRSVGVAGLVAEVVVVVVVVASCFVATTTKAQ